MCTEKNGGCNIFWVDKLPKKIEAVKKLVEKASQQESVDNPSEMDTQIKDLSETLLNALLLEKNGQYSYEDIAKIAMQMSKLSVALFEFSLNKELLTDDRKHEISEEITQMLKGIFLFCLKTP